MEIKQDFRFTMYPFDEQTITFDFELPDTVAAAHLEPKTHCGPDTCARRGTRLHDAQTQRLCDLADLPPPYNATLQCPLTT